MARQLIATVLQLAAQHGWQATPGGNAPDCWTFTRDGDKAWAWFTSAGHVGQARLGDGASLERDKFALLRNYLATPRPEGARRGAALAAKRDGEQRGTDAAAVRAVIGVLRRYDFGPSWTMPLEEAARRIEHPDQEANSRKD